MAYEKNLGIELPESAIIRRMKLGVELLYKGKNDQEVHCFI